MLSEVKHKSTFYYNQEAKQRNNKPKRSQLCIRVPHHGINDWPEKHKLDGVCWVLASSHILLNFIQLL